ncbi:hypothetical protein TNCV_495231 [Trichonephila clavipes]|nr:hypothetical protein TNCV_495231 [Trichonephila clavipes]
MPQPHHTTTCDKRHILSHDINGSNSHFRNHITTKWSAAEYTVSTSTNQCLLRACLWPHFYRTTRTMNMMLVHRIPPAATLRSTLAMKESRYGLPACLHSLLKLI